MREGRQQKETHVQPCHMTTKGAKNEGRTDETESVSLYQRFHHYTVSMVSAAHLNKLLRWWLCMYEYLKYKNIQFTQNIWLKSLLQF